MNCNFCLSKNIEQVYTPVKSKIDLHVNICKDCGKLYGRIKVVKLPTGFDLSEIHTKYGKPGIIKLLKKSFKLKESLL